MASVVAYNPAEFEKVSLTKLKKCLLKSHRKMLNSMRIKKILVSKIMTKISRSSDRLLAIAQFAPQQVQASGGSEVPDQWSHFKPKPNLAPNHLDQGVTHLTVSKLVDSMKTYITVGFRGMVPPMGVWMYIAPFLASSWWASMKSRGVQDKSLEEILRAIMDKSALLCPVHQRRIEFLKEGRNNCFHTNFLQRLEERIELTSWG